jgi:PAS domain S-box-containing protein
MSFTSKKRRQTGLAHFEATMRDFSETVSQAKARTAQIWSPTADLVVPEPDALRQALEELRSHEEELAVANEEMRAQLDELATATETAHSERDRYHELFDAAPDAYFVTDSLAVVRDVNAAAVAALAIEARFLYGKPLPALVDAADVRSLRDAIDELKATCTVAIEVRLRPRKGDPRWHALRATRIENGTAILWIARDVHERRVATDSLLRSHDGLEALASQRLRELERANRDKDDLLDRERHLRVQLEAAHVAKDHFLAVLSHDLRAPLNAVLGWTQLLRREKLDHGARERALATIERNAQAQLRLVEELLDISRIAADKVQLERTPLDLGELVRRAVDTIAPSATERGVSLAVAISEALVVVSGDRRRLEQVLTNLLSNAIKFTPSGGRVSVEVSRDPDGARLAVSDTGRGIAAELLPRVFDPFRQGADYATSREGLGLGLYIVRQAVEMHGGTVSVESKGLGQGTRFTVLLPMVAGPGSAVPSPPSEQSLPNPDMLEGIRVLVVDDEEDARELVAATLRHRGALVITAGDYGTALHAFDVLAPDVVVSDVAMPGRGGIELVRELRSRATATSFVAVSGFASAAEIDRALEAGFDVHLAKPVEPIALVRAVRDSVRARGR